MKNPEAGGKIFAAFYFVSKHFSKTKSKLLQFSHEGAIMEKPKKIVYFKYKTNSFLQRTYDTLFAFADTSFLNLIIFRRKSL